MTILLTVFGVTAVIIFLVAWRGRGAEVGTALTTAVVCTVLLAAITYLLANLSRMS